MEANFQTETVYTFDEYKKYNHTLLWRVKRVPIIILAMELVLLAVSYFTRDITYILGALLVPLIFKIVGSIQAKKTFQNNSDLHHMTLVYLFCDDYMEQRSRLGTGRIYYKEIRQVFETRTNFYLMIGRMDGLIIVKDNCSQALVRFLENLQRSGM